MKQGQLYGEAGEEHDGPLRVRKHLTGLGRLSNNFPKQELKQILEVTKEAQSKAYGLRTQNTMKEKKNSSNGTDFEP